MKPIATPVVLVFLALLIGTDSPIVAQESPSEIKRFAFGTPDSVLRSGFTKVTTKDAFNPQKGFGFQSTEGLEAFDRGGAEIVRPKDEYTASVYGVYRTTSDLTCALIEGTTNNAFQVLLPDGEYTIWIIASDAEWDPPLFEVWANGQKKLDVRIPRARFVFMEPLQARATDGRLSIEFEGPHGWILNGLVIGKEGPALAAMMKEIDRDVFFLTEPELPHWKELKPAPTNPPLKWTAAEKEQGYVVFPVDYTQPIDPTFVSERKDIGKPLTAFATPGEFEPATFCILAAKDLGHVAVELSDFTAEKPTRRLGRKNVTAGIVRCWPQRANDRGGKGEYNVVPEMIEPPEGRACGVADGQVKQWWLTVHVPPDAIAGRYRMSLSIRPEKAPPTVLEWRLLVLPFTLTRPAGKHWGTWLDHFPPVGGLYGPARRGRDLPAEVDRLARADIADLRNHGFDLVLLNYYFGAKENHDGTFSYDISQLARDLDYCKLLGSDAPVVLTIEYACRSFEYQFVEPGQKHVPGTFSAKAHQAIVGLVQRIRDEAARHDWPKLYYYPIDEPGNNKTENRYQFAEQVLDFVHEVPGCQTAVTVSSDCIRRLGGERVDVRIYAYGYYNRDKVLQDAKQGHPYWWYNNGMFYGHSTVASRGLAGFEFLRSGAEVASAWGFAATQANPCNDFDGGHKDWNVLFPGVDSPTPTVYWELCREGVDDARYVATLEQEIQKARSRGQTAAAQRAAQVLEPLVAAEAAPIENPLAFSRYRWRLAREILALQGDRKYPLPFPAITTNAGTPIKVGPNLLENPSFEDPPRADGSPPGTYHLGYPVENEKPAGTFTVTGETSHSGRCSLKWDLSKVADVASTGRNPRWLTVNVGFSSEMVQRLRGQRVRIGYWVKLGGGTTVPGLGLRQNLKDGPGEGFYYRGGLEDPAVWNHFETEGRLDPELQSMDIHTWCAIPEAELARKAAFYVDDISLQVIEEPPASISTPLDELYTGEPIRWEVTAPSPASQVMVRLFSGNRIIAEQASAKGPMPLHGAFDTAKLRPGTYTLKTSLNTLTGTEATAQRQVLVVPSAFEPWVK